MDQGHSAPALPPPAHWIGIRETFELGISEKTVKVHRARVMEKMRAGSVAGLVRLADRLAIARGIVDAHGGRLGAVNNPQGGATFHFTLPGRAEDE